MGKLSLLAFSHSDEHKHKRMFTRAILYFVSADFCNMFFLTGSFKGMCKQIDHFPEDADYEADASEYFLRESFFPS